MVPVTGNFFLWPEISSCGQKFLPVTRNFFLWQEISFCDRKCLPVTGNVFLWQEMFSCDRIWRPKAPSFLASLTPLKCLLLVLFCQIIHVQHFQSFFLHGETIKTFTRLTDTLLDTSLMDWTSQLELSLAKFDITVWMSVGRFSQTPCTHITTLCWSWKPCNSHYETNALCI